MVFCMEFALSNPQPQEPAKFPLGTPVKVKTGTTDPDFPDISLGGWAGTVQEIDAVNYLVKWSQGTLDQMNSIYRERCERAELNMKTMWLEENDLELDTDEPVGIEQPTVLVSRSLSQVAPVDYMRAMLGGSE